MRNLFSPFTIKRYLFSLIFFSFSFFIVLFLLIGLYHTTIFATASGLSSVLGQGLPASALSLGSGVFSLPSPVQCLLCLITLFLHVVIFYLSVGAEFLALVFLIVYVGAIAILFLFVIMLLNVKELATAARRILAATQRAAQIMGVPFSVVYVALLSFFLSSLFGIHSLINSAYVGAVITQITSYVTHGYQDVLVFAQLLYCYYSSLFIDTALLLLTAMIGSIVLAAGSVDKSLPVNTVDYSPALGIFFLILTKVPYDS